MPSPLRFDRMPSSLAGGQQHAAGDEEEANGNIGGRGAIATGGASAAHAPRQHPAPHQHPHPTALSNPPPPHGKSALAHNLHAAAWNQNTRSGADDGDAPPPKRRKLTAAAPNHSQTTLDAHFAPRHDAPLPKPPIKVTLAEPHGQVIETRNGVSTALDVDEDELLRPSSPKLAPYNHTRAPRRKTRSPTPLPAHAPQSSKQEEKRTLRSQDDGPRLKSDLAIYFPNYEDIIFDAPQETELLTADTTLYIVDDAPPAIAKVPAAGSKSSNNTAALPGTPQRSITTQLNGSPHLDLDIVARTIPDNAEDPLSDAHFIKSHKRAERREKQLRNIERERAMHEKVQLDRLLEGLKGHDWLKVLGITGITDGEAKKYEAKRQYFISEVQALVDKFKQWREQEKKQRLEKEAAAATPKHLDSEDVSPAGSVEPPSSDLNASAARQLQQETLKSIKPALKPSNKGKERAVDKPLAKIPLAPPSPEIPITSFYAKRHLRDAALGKARHGRNVTAFGQPIPEMEECEFELPAEYVTEDALRANARERRRRKREIVANASGA